MDNTKQYDEVINLMIQNVIAERNLCEKIILWNFDPNDDGHRLYFHAACILSDFNKELIYLDSNFQKILSLRWHMRKRRNIRRLTRRVAVSVKPENRTSVDTIINYICDYLKIDRSLLKEINDEYYGWE